MAAVPGIVSLEQLRRHLQAVCQPRDPFENHKTLLEVQEYIRNFFDAHGYLVREQPFQCEGRSFVNLIAQLPGILEVPKLIVGAHFDAVPGTPGADDNASGVAAMLEVARLAASSCRPNPEVQFVAFNLEEYGMLGSQHYVRCFKDALARAHQKGNFLGMLSLEMVGYTDSRKGSQKIPPPLQAFYPDSGNFLALVGDGASKNFLQWAKSNWKAEGLAVEILQVPFRGNIFPEVRLSDHSPFWDVDLPALLVTDTSFFRNPNYHLPSDTLETLDMGFLKKVTEGMACLVQMLEP